MMYPKEALEKLAASSKEAVVEWERRPISARLQQMAYDMEFISHDPETSTIRVRVSQPLVDGMPRLRAMYRRSRWPRMTEVKSEYHRRRRNR